MSTWAERYKADGVWAQLEALGPAIDAALKREELSVEQSDNLERLRAALTYLGKRLGAADPFLALPSALGTIAESLRNAIAHVQSFSQNGDNNHLSNASSQLDSALNQCSINVPITTAEGIEGLSTIVSVYRLAMTKQLEEFSKRANAHAEELTANEGRFKELQAGTTAEQQRTGSALADMQTQFNAAQATREQQSATQSGTFQEQFSATQAKRDESYNNAQTTRQTRFDDLHAEYSTKLTERAADFEKNGEKQKSDLDASVATLRTEYEADAMGILNQIEEQKTKVEKLVSVIGNLGVTSGYQKAASQALWALRFWQFVAVAAMGTLIYIAVTKFLPAADVQAKGLASKGFDWPGFALRVYVSLTIGVLAAYAGTQADKYYRIERKNRKMALELEAIGPFLQPLPEEEQQKFRITIGDRSFGRDDEPGDERSPTNLIHLLNSKEGRAFLAEVVKLSKQP